MRDDSIDRGSNQVHDEGLGQMEPATETLNLHMAHNSNDKREFKLQEKHNHCYEAGLVWSPMENVCVRWFLSVKNTLLRAISVVVLLLVEGSR